MRPLCRLRRKNKWVNGGTRTLSGSPPQQMNWTEQKRLLSSHDEKAFLDPLCPTTRHYVRKGFILIS